MQKKRHIAPLCHPSAYVRPQPLSTLVMALRRASCVSAKVGVTAFATSFICPVTMAELIDNTTKRPITTQVTDTKVAKNSDKNSENKQSANQLTALDSATSIAPVEQKPFSAKTRPNFTPNLNQQHSLERLHQYYQPVTPAKDNAVADTSESVHSTRPPMCYGAWVYPSATYQQQQALDASKTNKPNSEFPLYAEADYGYYDNENHAELSGNVQINQGRQQISADKVVVNLADGVAAAQGNVLLVDASQSPEYQANSASTTITNTTTSQSLTKNAKGGLITVADEIAYETDSAKATAKDVAFASVPLQAHGYAKQLNKVDESRYEIDDVMFTTCAPDNPTWQINAKNIDIDTDTGRGKVYNATLKVKNTPILYLPYFNFPIDDRRTSGFLLPRAGFSSDGGFNVQVPYYFNLAPNYDATLTTSVYTNRNPMISSEFRYLTDEFGYGNLTASYLPHDREYHDQDRSRVLFNHQWQSKDYPTLSAEAVYQYVSDGAYFNDFDPLGSFTNQLNLPRRVQANYYNDYLTAKAKFETFQTLNSDVNDTRLIQDKDKPYYRLPQISLQYRLPWVDNVDITGVSDFAYFKRPIKDGSALEQSGGRLYNKLTASYPLTRPWGYVKPAISLQHLYTQFDQATTLANHIDKDNKSQSIFVPEYSLDAGLNFFKAGSPLAKLGSQLGTGGYQLISPRVKYVYSPYREQTNVPNFNTRLASLSFEQLYENSWFLGYDRLPDNNHLTPSVNYRYIDDAGLTRLDASIGQRMFFDDIRVRLDNTNTPIKVDRSATVLQLSAQPFQTMWADLDGAINNNGGLNYYNAQLRYQPFNQTLYNVGVIKRTNDPLGQRDLSALTASAIFPINDNWRFLGAVQYDNRQSRFSDVLAGVNYESCCYGFSIYGRSYYNELDQKDKPNRAVMAELSLNGIANKRDGRLASLISDRVLGYNPLSHF